MGKSRVLAIALLALAACGSDKARPDAQIVIQDAPPPDMKIFEDAPPPMFDFSCMGNAAPDTATAQITMSGTVQRVYLNGAQPAIEGKDGAVVNACAAGQADCTGENQYGTATSEGGGNFSIGPVDTGMVPLDVYVEMTEATSRTTQVYPPSPLVADQGMVPVLTFDPNLITLLGNFGCDQDDTNNGMLILRVVDCSDAAIDDTTNLTLSIKQGGNEVAGTSVLDLSGFDQQLGGTFLVCNVPEGDVTTVGASYNSMDLRAHDVKIVKGTTTATIIRPGY